MNVFLCILELFTVKNIPYMVVEAMFANMFYTAFLLTEEVDEDYYAQNSRRKKAQQRKESNQKT